MKSPKKLKPKLTEVLEAARGCHRILEENGLRHLMIGSVAVFLHLKDTSYGKERKPRDVDILIAEDAKISTFKSLHSAGYVCDSFRKALLDPQGVRIDLHWDGKGGRRMPLPDCSRCTWVEALPVVDVEVLIEMLTGSNEPKHRLDLDHLLTFKK